jgi:hypothetical protein
VSFLVNARHIRSTDPTVVSIEEIRLTDPTLRPWVLHREQGRLYSILRARKKDAAETRPTKRVASRREPTPTNVPKEEALALKPTASDKSVGPKKREVLRERCELRDALNEISESCSTPTDDEIASFYGGSSDGDSCDFYGEREEEDESELGFVCNTATLLGDQLGDPHSLAEVSDAMGPAFSVVGPYPMPLALPSRL